MRFQKRLQYPRARRTRAGHHHVSDMPTSARAILHHTDQNGQNILKGSVYEEIRYLEKRKNKETKALVKFSILISTPAASVSGVPHHFTFLAKEIF